MASNSTVLAMPNKRSLLGALLVAGQFFSASVLAATRQSVTYQIDRAWFDADHVYILFEKRIAKEHYSLKDVHGTISKEQRSVRLVSYPREKLRDGALVELGEGVSAESVVYKDMDFSVNIVAKDAMLSGRGMPADVNVCQNAGEASFPIRSRDTLFFCGKMYGLSGNVVFTVPDAILRSITNALKPVKQGGFELLGGREKLVFVVDDKRTLLITTSRTSVSPLKVGVWPIGGKEIKWGMIDAGQPGQRLFVANDVTAYSPNSIVLKDSTGQWTICRKFKCDPVGKLRASGTFLLIDDLAGEAMSLSLPNLTQPRVLVHLEKGTEKGTPGHIY